MTHKAVPSLDLRGAHLTKVPQAQSGKLRQPIVACQPHGRPSGCRLNSHSQASTSARSSLGPAVAGFLLGSSSSLWLTSNASAQQDGFVLLILNPQGADLHQVLSAADTASLAELTFLPSIQLTPLGVLTFLLQHPFVTLGVAAALYYIVPRVFRTLVRFLVVPAVIALVAYVVLQNPQAALGLVESVNNCKSLPQSNWTSWQTYEIKRNFEVI